MAVGIGAERGKTPRRYEPVLKLASGGMATVHLGYSRGALGFRQVVAIKRPHPHLLENPSFRQSFVAEAMLASKIHHANVVDVRDVEVADDSIDLVMDYVEGASLSKLQRGTATTFRPMPVAVAVRIVLDACAGLHAAHEAADELGEPLGIVHRDVSPQNILVGVDGVSRLVDFGIAKCGMAVTTPTTQEGTLKGKVGYMAPEYLLGGKLDRRADIFGLGVVLWEALCGRALFAGDNEATTILQVLQEPIPPLHGMAPEMIQALQPVVDQALSRDPQHRFATALAMSTALDHAARSCGLRHDQRAVGDFVKQCVGAELEERRAQLRDALASRESLVGGPGQPGLKPDSGEVPATAAPAVAEGSAVSIEMPRARSRSPNIAFWAGALVLVAITAVASAAIVARVVAQPGDSPAAVPQPATSSAVPSSTSPATVEAASAVASAIQVPSADAASPTSTARHRTLPASPAKPSAPASPPPPRGTTPKGPPPNPYGE